MAQAYIDILKSIYQTRKRRDPAYTIAQFSKDAGFKSYHMSDVFSGRYGISKKRAVIVAENLKMPERQAKTFLRLVADLASKSKADKKDVQFEKQNLDYNPQKVLPDNKFGIVSEWYYFAILEMLRKMPGDFKASVLAKKIGISTEQVELGVIKLKEYQLISEVNGKLFVNDELVSILNNVSSQSIRRYHRSMIVKSLLAMEEVPVDKRYFASFNLNLSKEAYDEMHEDLSAFIRKKLVQLQDESQGTQQLHALNFQIFPLERNDQ